MAIDIRADVSCSLGPVISGSIGDSYIQGSGLVQTTGEVEINALITPAIGTIVTFSYTKAGVAKNIPRKLRVLSSFADPIRRTTKIELGCKLTYLSDLKESLSWDAFDDPVNYLYTPQDARRIVIPFYASSVMDFCLSKIGITASHNPLTNRFSVDKFDFSSGYVQILSDLLLSESYFGYLDFNETLQVVDLTQEGGEGVVYTLNDIVDLSQINSGQLPGESVIVTYNTTKFKASVEAAPIPEPEPFDIQERFWEYNEVTSGPNYYTVGNYSFSGNETVITNTVYTRINKSDLPTERITREYACTAKIMGSYGTSLLDAGLKIGDLPLSWGQLVREQIETTSYDQLGNKIGTRVIVSESPLAVAGSLNLNYAFSYPDPSNSGQYLISVVPYNGGYLIANLVPTSETVSSYYQAGNFQREITNEYRIWVNTIPGQQAIAMAKNSLNTFQAVQDILASAFRSGTVHARTTESINEVNETPKRPDNVLKASLAKDATDKITWSTESIAEINLALGSATAQRRTEFSMPYAPDDAFVSLGYGAYYSRRSDASAKATRFGRIQNRLLLGNRNGMNLQLSAEKLPSSPFSPICIQANGLTGLYRTNSNQWAFDQNGIACSTDALFWGAIGGTGVFWFPVAPGVVELPETPPVIDGKININKVVTPYNETSVYRPVVRTQLYVQKFNYSLNVVTQVPVIRIRAVLQAGRVMNASSIPFTLEGKEAILNIPNRVLPAFIGAISLGRPEALFYPPVLSASTGGFLLNGQNADAKVLFDIYEGTIQPSLGDSGITDYYYPIDLGWHWVEYQQDINDGYGYLSGMPFNLTINSVSAPVLFFSGNTYITIGGLPHQTPPATNQINQSSPSFSKILLGTGDNSMQQLLVKSGISGDGSSYYRVRYEGTDASTGTPGYPTIVLEITFYEPRENGDQWIGLRVGPHARADGLFMIASQTQSLASATLTPNSSWVFIGNSAGTSWSMTSNRYIP